MPQFGQAPGSKAHHAGRFAVEQGCAAMAAGDADAAVRWFGRACRLAPGDASPPYLLAVALAGSDPARALASVAGVTGLHRDARVLEVALLRRLGRTADAAAALSRLLCRFAAPRAPSFQALADAVCRDAAVAGWVGVWGDGQAVFRADGIVLRLGRRRLAVAAGAAQCPLPQGWRRAGVLAARVPAGVVLGARIDLGVIGRVEGVVALAPGGVLTGWALTAADPDTRLVLTVHDAAGAEVASGVADDEDFALDGDDGARRVRGFRIAVPAAGVLHVRGPDGKALMGSPVDGSGERLACRGAVVTAVDPWRPLPVALAAPMPPGRTVPGRRPADVVIPLYRGAALFAACLASLEANPLPGLRIVAVDDAVAEPALRRLAEAAASAGRIVLLRHKANLGFPAAANTGLRHAAGRDVVLLNSDTLLPPGALARLAAAAYADAETGTVTPMTQDGTLTSRWRDVAEPMPGVDRLAALDAAFGAANAGLRVALPSCVGFCTYVRHDCLAETGLLREDAFAQGYGEETDFSLRAAQLGFRHVAACDVLVGHAGGASFGSAGAALRTRNQAVLERLHPGFAAMVSAWMARDPLGPARSAGAAALWGLGRRARSVVLVTHDRGGGVERHLAGRVAAVQAAGDRAIVVRPDDGGFVLADGLAAPGPLRFADVAGLAAFLAPDGPVLVELHHVADHAPGILRLAGLLRVPFDFFAHDYAPVCPQVTLCAGPAGYCGEPADRRDCEDCVADHGAAVPVAGCVAAHRDRQAEVLRLARRVLAPSQDTAARYRRFVNRLNPVVVPWEDDAGLTRGVRRPRLPVGAAVHVAVVGGIGHDKGFDVLLGCARDAARRGLPLRFTVVGHTVDDARLFATGRVFVTGEFAEGGAAGLLGDAAADLGFVPSVWPETWCFALSALWQAGLHVTAFGLGAQAERITASGAGALLALGTPASQVNEHFLQVASGWLGECDEVGASIAVNGVDLTA